jgi:pimeloyl-ACP methyl ester carboxylesterase
MPTCRLGSATIVTPDARAERGRQTVDDLVIDSQDGTRLSARRSGAGTPLVLVHGGLVDRNAFAFVEPLLAERYEVWTYDRRGHGASGDATDLTLERELEDLAAVLAIAGSSSHLVGHSDGARICLDAAAGLPDLRSLVVYEPAVHFEVRGDAFRRATRALEAGDIEGFLDVFLRDVAAALDHEVTMLRSVPEAWDMLVRGARRYAALGDAFGRRVDEMVAQGWQPDRYRSIVAPTLLVTGELTQSPLFATSDEIRKAVAHADVRQLAGQGHLAPSFAPDLFAQTVLTFTSGHDR